MDLGASFEKFTGDCATLMARGATDEECGHVG